MSDGISPNKLNDLSKVYLDQINTFREIRKQETAQDIERWSQPAKEALQQEAVKGVPTQDRKDDAAERRAGKYPLKSKKAGESYAKWTMRKHPASVDEAKVDTGSAEEKATARNKRNTPAGKDSKFDTSVFITRKPGESLDSARTRTRQKAHVAKRGVKESISNWRNELREISDFITEPETEKKADKEVTEKKVKNIVKINPTLPEAVAEIGGELISVEEGVGVALGAIGGGALAAAGGVAAGAIKGAGSMAAAGQQAASKNVAQAKKERARQQVADKQAQDIKRAGGVTEQIEAAVDYLYEEGLNEEGIDLLIEEIGLDGFVEFVEGSAVELNEARAARRANVKAKSYADVKAAVDKSDAAKKKAKKGEYAPSYAKKETDVTVYDDKAPAKKKAAAKKAPAGMKKAVARKKAVLKQPVKKTAPKAKGGAIVKAQPTSIVKAVTKVKKAQPAKKATKQRLGDKIRSAYKKGVERHKASVGKAKTEVGKVVKTVKTTAKQHSKHRKDFVSGISPTAREKKIAKGVGGAVKKALTKEELELLEKVKGQSTEYRRERAAERRVPGDPHKKQGDPSKRLSPSAGRTNVGKMVRSIEKYDKQTKATKPSVLGMVTKEEVGISSSAAMKKAREEAKLQKKEAEAVKKVKKEEVNPIVARNDRLNKERAMKAAKEREAKKPSADVIAARKRQYSGKNYTVADKKKVIQSYREDKAFDNVVSMLRKKHGEGSVITKDSPKPKSKPLNAKQIWRKDDRNAVQREVDAQYGKTPWNKKGSLGT